MTCSAATGVELQFSRVRVRVESRPRAGAHALHVSLGAVCLLSRITPGSLFPVLIAPQVRPTRFLSLVYLAFLSICQCICCGIVTRA